MRTIISGETKLAGVIAQPIKHSLSPMIHNTAYHYLGIDAVYLAFEVEQQQLEKAIESIRGLNMLGVNISMPYKKQAYDLCDEISERAKLIGVVNTIINKDNQLVGDNTDGLGFIGSLWDHQVSVTGKIMTLLGAGGAAKAVICQSALEGVKEINVFKRNNDSFETVKKDLEKVAIKTKTTIHIHDYQNKELMKKMIEKSQIIVNATQIGMGEDMSIPIYNSDLIHSSHTVVDLIYHPLETSFLKEAKGKGAVTINGLGMLVHQAAYAFELMTDKQMPVKQIKQKLLNQL